MANELAHQINNPLQSMTNAAYILATGCGGEESQVLGRELSDDIHRLSGLVKKLLAIPFEATRAGDSSDLRGSDSDL